MSNSKWWLELGFAQRFNERTIHFVQKTEDKDILGTANCGRINVLGKLVEDKG